MTMAHGSPQIPLQSEAHQSASDCSGAGEPGGRLFTRCVPPKTRSSRSATPKKTTPLHVQSDVAWEVSRVSLWEICVSSGSSAPPWQSVQPCSLWVVACGLSPSLRISWSTIQTVDLAKLKWIRRVRVRFPQAHSDHSARLSSSPRNACRPLQLRRKGGHASNSCRGNAQHAHA